MVRTVPKMQASALPLNRPLLQKYRHEADMLTTARLRVAYLNLSLEIVRAPEGEQGITSAALSPRGTFPDPPRLPIWRSGTVCRTASSTRTFAEIGGLMSFGADGPASFRHGAKFVQRILQGRQPRDLPIEQPTKFELAINLKTAKAIGLTLPETFLLRADTVLE
jgi:hypothetical protein